MTKFILATFITLSFQNLAAACPVSLTGKFSASDFYGKLSTIKIEQNATCTEITFTILKDKEAPQSVTYKTDDSIFGQNAHGFLMASSYSDSALEVKNVTTFGLKISNPTRLYLDKNGDLVQEAGTVENIVIARPGLLSEQKLVKFEKVTN